MKSCPHAQACGLIICILAIHLLTYFESILQNKDMQYESSSARCPLCWRMLDSEEGSPETRKAMSFMHMHTGLDTTLVYWLDLEAPADSRKQFVEPKSLFPFLLVNIGSGVSIVRVDDASTFNGLGEVAAGC